MPSSIAVVTGASSGIGYQLALALAEAGVNVVGVARRADKLAELNAQSANIDTLAADLSHADGRMALSQWLSDRDLSVRYLAHSIGTVQPIRKLDGLTVSEWRASQATNIEAPLFTTLDLSGHIGEGRILFVGSASSSRPRQGWGAYCCAKSALHMAHRCLRLEWSDRPILIASAKLGPVETDIMEHGITADSEIFPDRALFEDMRNNGQVASARTVAVFLRWLLLECPVEQYEATDWEMGDTSHHVHWLTGDLYQD